MPHMHVPGGPMQPQGNFFYPPTQNPNNISKSNRRRPGTASRRNQAGAAKKMFTSKNPSTLDLEVSRMRPRVINVEREKLYDDAMKQRITANFLKDENIKLKTRLHIMEGELQKKEKLVDDLLMQQDSFQVGAPISSKSAYSKLKLDSHLSLNLKRKIRDLQNEIAEKSNETETLKRNIKNTKISEIEVEMKMYIDECTRLRHQLEEVIKSKDTFADPEELRLIEEKF